MKALVVIGASIRLCPYAHPYINELLLAGYDVTAAVWIRDGQPDIDIDSRVNRINYKRELDDAVSKWKKVSGFIGFRRMVVKELSKKYDFVVVLDTQFAVLLSDRLLRHYKGKFVYDMRDLSYEGIGIYRKRVERIVDASCAVFISSDAYRQFLPLSDKIYTTHNILMEDLKYEGIRNQESREHQPIRVSFWGMIRDVKLNNLIINILGNDDRFELHYYGMLNELSQGLVEYCQNQGYDNVYFHGRYEPRERYYFARNTELIHNIYSNATEQGNPAMGNKYYDGIVFQIPQVCMLNGYMGERVKAKNVGIAINVDSNLGDVLYKYYTSIEWKEFNKACILEEQDIIREYDIARAVLQAVIRGEEPSEYIIK